MQWIMAHSRTITPDGSPPDAGVPLSLLMLSPDPKVVGGVTTFIKMVMERLVNCKVTFMAVGSLKEQAGNMEMREGLFPLLKRIVIIPFKVAYIASHQHFDVIHINPSFNPKGLLRDGLTLLALRLTGYRRVLVYFHGWQWDTAQRIHQTPALRHGLAWLLNGTGHIMVLAPEFKQSLEDMGVRPEKVTFARTMFDGDSLKAVLSSPPPFTGEAGRGNLSAHSEPADRFPPPAPPASGRGEGRRRSILFMSRFVREKGIFELVEAFARLAAEYPDVDLIMAGDGPDNAALRAAAAKHGLGERIQFPGYVGGAEKFKMLRACTIYALPTYFPEGMPVALLEAMGAGKPVLTAKAGSIAHIIADPDNGIVLGSVTADSVEAALRRMLSDPDYCAQTGKRNAAYAGERFEATKVTAEIEALYRDIARQ